MKTLIALKESGLPLNEALTLCHFAQNENTQQHELAATLGWSAPLASQLTGRVTRKGLLLTKSGTDPVNGRTVTLYRASAKGKKIAKSLGA
jgi:DNA-binding MarR family transcriptional regulator